MRINIIHIVCVFFGMTSLSFSAQDIHFSQFDHSPLNLNPAFTGQFKGDYRFIGNYRTQWSSVTVPFNTIAFAADAKDFKMKNVGAGIQVNQDRTGDSKFNTFQVNASGSYSLPLSKDSLQNLSFGLQTGITNRNFKYPPLYFDAQYNGFYFDENLPTNESFAQTSRTYLNLHSGAQYSWEITERKSISAGFALFNINQPKQSFYNDDNIRLDRRFVAHANASWKVHEAINVQPSMLFMAQGTYKEFDLGARIQYVLTDFMGIYRTVWGGIFYRNKDAAFLVAGVDYDQWKAGISYDINTSTLVPASNRKGGLELSLIYIIDNTPPKRIIHRICPDYI